MDEVRSLAVMLRQSIEFGLASGENGRPLGLFIFPVILGIAMLPG